MTYLVNKQAFFNKELGVICIANHWRYLWLQLQQKTKIFISE